VRKRETRLTADMERHSVTRREYTTLQKNDGEVTRRVRRVRGLGQVSLIQTVRHYDSTSIDGARRTGPHRITRSLHARRTLRTNRRREGRVGSTRATRDSMPTGSGGRTSATKRARSGVKTLLPARGTAKGQKLDAGQGKRKAENKRTTSSRHEGDRDRRGRSLRGEQKTEPNVDPSRRTHNATQVDLGLRLVYASAFNLVAKHIQAYRDALTRPDAVPQLDLRVPRSSPRFRPYRCPRA